MRRALYTYLIQPESFDAVAWDGDGRLAISVLGGGRPAIRRALCARTRSVSIAASTNSVRMLWWWCVCVYGWRGRWSPGDPGKNSSFTQSFRFWWFFWVFFHKPAHKRTMCWWCSFYSVSKVAIGKLNIVILIFVVSRIWSVCGGGIERILCFQRISKT